jgi:hypothetical protein
VGTTLPNPVSPEGSLFYKSDTDIFYISNGTQWNLVSNANPATTGGTRTIGALSEGGTFSYDLGDDFTDDVDTDAQLIYTLASGTLPSGCTLPTTGNSAFTGTASGVSSNTNYTFTIKVTDTSGGTATQDYQQTINTVAPMVTGGTVTIAPINVSVSSSYDVGTNFTFGTGATFSAYSLQSGSLPSGLSLNTTSGVISGTPSSTQTVAFTIRGTDTDGDTADQAYSWVVVPPPFTTHTFTNAGSTGRFGPTLDMCKSEYSPDWVDDPSSFNMTSQGVQLWTVPSTGTYQITAQGAQGMNDNSSTKNVARMRGSFSLSAGTVLSLVVGQAGSAVEQGSGTTHPSRNLYGVSGTTPHPKYPSISSWNVNGAHYSVTPGTSYGGGGGGSFVYVNSSSTPMIIGGGSGGGNQNTTLNSANTGHAGNQDPSTVGVAHPATIVPATRGQTGHVGEYCTSANTADCSHPGVGWYSDDYGTDAPHRNNGGDPNSDIASVLGFPEAIGSSGDNFSGTSPGSNGELDMIGGSGKGAIAEDGTTPWEWVGCWGIRHWSNSFGGFGGGGAGIHQGGGGGGYSGGGAVGCGAGSYNSGSATTNTLVSGGDGVHGFITITKL